MTPAARLAAAIEVFAAIEAERRPAADALKAWGLTHRFAGSGDRAGIAGLVYDGLRRRASSAFLMGADTPRAILFGMLRRERGLDTEAIAKLADGGQYAPAELTADERKHLDGVGISAAPPHVAGDYPEWLDGHLSRTFG
jgi:16S rRNA (cytosine967-C5)-methyltransferase